MRRAVLMLLLATGCAHAPDRDFTVRAVTVAGWLALSYMVARR